MNSNAEGQAPDPAMQAIEAAAFRRLVHHLRLREDATNIDLMGLAGFCRNCLADWLAEASDGSSKPLSREAAGKPLSRDAARTYIYGEPYASFKARQPEATAGQVARMDASLALNEEVRAAPPATLSPRS